ncbi:MAG TPA: alanine--tRNA ligase, partial [Fimbriimonadaceae bacterium]|nr:alanine--tRNA ligase [Fimbriimonadaceae bacterium]
MTARELRRKYIDFFISKGHDQYPSGSLIPYDVTGKLDESLLFNGAGMVQFKPFFRGVASPPNPRLTNAQKVVRTGDIEEVGDDSHLTFFEMLGNFSFGDYFKAEAIGFSWEFLTSPQWLGLDPRRLSFTVFEEDDEAYGHWAEHLASVGIDPSTRIFRLDEEKNFWPAGSFSSGPPGPCGPNSEMFYWTSESEPPPSGAYTRADWWRDSEEQGKWLEIWNDVFIQYEWKGRLRNPNRPTDGYEKEGMPELPFRSIDTGMGLERTITALTGKSSIYDNDLFYPIFRALAALGAEDAMRFADAPADDRRGGAGRVIADHIRTACFCIADGILPANSGRGYVLRRLIRRAVLKGQRVLGFEDIFLYRLYTAVAEALGDHYTELVDRKDVIVETLRNEEALFRRTLHSGSTLLSQELQKLGGDPIKTAVADAIETLVPGSSAAIPKPSGGQVLPGDLAFKLYDTYGFPLEVTEELATEAGVSVDLEGYEIALRQAQERSRGSSSMDTVYAAEDEALILSVSPRAQPFSTFVGYDRTEHLCEIVQISPRFNAEGLTTGQFQICLDETPFYAESGGQITDTGTISCPDFELHVERVWKEMGLIWHDAQVVRANLQGSTPGAVDNGVPTSGLTQDAIASLLDSGYFFRPVEAKVDAVRRRSITRNHSATHLLHAALREVLGKHVTQAGSLVAPDYLRFDFTHGKAMTSEELAEVERIVNGKALEGTPVTIFQDIPIAEA